MTPGSVVPEMSDVTEAEFHAAQITGLARAEKKVGTRRLANLLDLTVKQMGNILHRGASTHPKRGWDALGACPTALDDVAKLYRKRLVDADAIVVLEDQGTLPIVKLLNKVAAAECPTSPGGTSKTHQELLDMEDEIRRVNALTGNWIELINGFRERTPPG